MVLVDGLLEDAVHHMLERGGGVSETEKHDVWHEDAELRLEGGLVPIFLPNTDVVIALAHVEFGENAGVPDASNRRGNKRHWIEISLCQCICFPIILNWPV
jgi:hypothetical protein